MSKVQSSGFRWLHPSPTPRGAPPLHGNFRQRATVAQQAGIGTLSRWAPVYPGWTHGFEGLQQPKRKKDQKSMSHRWIFNDIYKKWLEMNTNEYKMLEYFRLLHFGLTSSQTRQSFDQSPSTQKSHGSMMIQVIHDQLSPGQPGCG